jgi:oligo-alginate lyase
MNRRHFLQSTAALAAAYALPTWADPATLTTQPTHTPSLLLTPAGVALLKIRITTEPFAQSQWTDLTRTVSQAIAKPLLLPPRGGNWSHNYVCPTHGARLRTGKKIADWNWQHTCPVGPHTLLGNPKVATLDFDGNVLMNIHLQNADLLTNAALLSHIQNDGAPAAYARQLLAAYAEKYLIYPLHDMHLNPKVGGHVACQPLTEASWLVVMAQGADLIWATLSDPEKSAAESKLFRPALTEILLPSKLGIHNIQCRINSAIGLVGFLLHDQHLIDIAIDDPKHGFRQQIAQGINPDGLWLEGASGYHFFTIEGLWPLAEAAKNNGVDLYSEKFKSMFDAPLLLARPDAIMPDFNDSEDTPLAGHADLYELALARYHDPHYAALIAYAGRTRTAKPTEEADTSAPTTARHNRLALLFGISPLPTGNLPARQSQNDTASGYAIIQRGTDENATWLCLKYGPHGGGHGHFDKNTFILYSQKSVLSPDAGTHAYGSPLHTQWDKTSLAHNTLAVDEESQAPATGKSLAFGSSHGTDFSITDAGPIYPGVTFLRTAALIDENLILFIDHITSEEEHTYDLALHLTGTWQNLPEGQPWTAPKKPGYQWFTNTTSRPSTQSSVLSTQSCTITLAPHETPTELITGTGVLKTTADLTPMLLLRRKTKSTTYIWTLSLTPTPITLATTTVNSDLQVTLTRADLKKTFLINPTATNPFQTLT